MRIFRVTEGVIGIDMAGDLILSRNDAMVHIDHDALPLQLKNTRVLGVRGSVLGRVRQSVNALLFIWWPK